MKKLTIPAILIIVIGLVSCNKSNDSQNAVGEKNKAIADKFLQAQKIGDITTMSELLTDDYIDYGPVLDDSATKAQFLASEKKMFEETFNPFEYERIAIVALDDWVFDWGILTANFKSGSKAKIKYHYVLRLKGGKINLTSSFFNEADYMRQLGYKLVPPGEEKSVEPTK